MSKRFEFERFDVRGCACDECDTWVTTHAEFDGEWVKAKDALDREAVLLAKISALEAQCNQRAAPKRVRLPDLSEELYEFYPAMSAQSHKQEVKNYARAAIKSAMGAATEVT